jgi:hypothetical protein
MGENLLDDICPNIHGVWIFLKTVAALFNSTCGGAVRCM